MSPEPNDLGGRHLRGPLMLVGNFGDGHWLRDHLVKAKMITQPLRLLDSQLSELVLCYQPPLPQQRTIDQRQRTVECTDQLHIQAIGQ